MVSMEEFESLRESVNELRASIGAMEADNNDIMDGMMDMATCMSGITDKFGGQDTSMMPTDHESTYDPSTTRRSTYEESTTYEPSTTRRSTYEESTTYKESTVQPTERWESLGTKLVDPMFNKCSTSANDRSFKLKFTDVFNCLNRCDLDDTCLFASTDNLNWCIGCKVLNQYSDNWDAYEMINMKGRRQLSELEQLRAENAALKAELARRRN